MKSLAVSEPEKTLDLEEFFNTINVRNDPLIQIKKNLIQLLSELVENKIIQNEVEVILKSDKKKYPLIENLTTSDITRRIKYIQLHEILQKNWIKIWKIIPILDGAFCLFFILKVVQNAPSRK
jgi:hypothetical protein